MANTYYNSELTADEIEAVLEAINGILTPANNGKVLAISNGKLEARSVQWGGGGEAVIEPLSVTQNGIYNPPSGVDGYAPVTVNVGGGDVLPTGYTALSYIESDGTQYIDTGVPINGNFVIDCDFSLSAAPSGWHGFLGGGYGNVNSSFSFLINGLTTASFQHGSGNSYNDVSFQFSLDTLYNVHLAHGFSIGDTYYPYINFSSSNNCLLFKVHWDVSAINARIYRFDLHTGITLARHMVPAMRDSDGEVGMYDFVTETFFTNAGPGTFLYG